MTIKDHFDHIEKLFAHFYKEKNQLETIEDFICDMQMNPSKFAPTICPISGSNLVYAQIALRNYFSLKIYVELESLYKTILIEFDSTAGSIELWNIKIPKILNKFINSSSQGAVVKRNPSHQWLLESVVNSIKFDELNSPEYSIISSFIEWRGANVHFSSWSSSLDLVYFKEQLILHKVTLIKLHERFLRYLIALKTPWFSEDFDSFI